MKLGEFFIDLIVDSSKGELTVGNLVTKMGQLEAATVGAIGVVFELANKMAQFTDISIKTALGLGEYTTLTGKAADELQRWQRVAVQMNVPVEAITDAFTGLSASLAKLRAGGGADESLMSFINVFGLNLRKANGDLKDAVTLITEVGNSPVYKGMSNSQKTLWLGKSMNPLMQRLLDMTPEERSKMADIVPGMSEESVKKFEHIHSVMAAIGLEARQIATDIASWDAGAITKSLEFVRDSMTGIRNLFGASEKLQGAIKDPLSKESMASGVAMASRFASPEAIEFSNMLTDVFMKFFHTGPIIQDAALLPAPGVLRNAAPVHGVETKNVEVKVNNNFNGVHTPDSLKKAAADVFDNLWGKKLGDTAQMAGAGNQ